MKGIWCITMGNNIFKDIDFSKDIYATILSKYGVFGCFCGVEIIAVSNNRLELAKSYRDGGTYVDRIKLEPFEKGYTAMLVADGSTYFYTFTKEGKYASYCEVYENGKIRDMHTCTKYVRMGYGMKLIELVNSTLGNKTLHTIIEKSNVAEINLYKKMGYIKDPKYRDRTLIQMIRMVSTN